MGDLDPSIHVRRGRPDEAEALARLHVDVWRATYRDLAPSEAVKLLDEARRLPYWTRATTLTEAGRGVWVADGDGTLLGVVSVGASDHPIFEGRAELKHLYVAGDAQGRGVGARLLRRAIDDCQAAGDVGLALAVVKQNARARRFYGKMGGIEVAEFTDAGPLWRSDNILVAWDFRSGA